MSNKHHKKAAFGPSGSGRVYARDSNPPPPKEKHDHLLKVQKPISACHRGIR